MTGMAEELVPNSLVSAFAALGLDLRSSDFPRRYVDEWMRNRSLLSKYERLLEHARLQETAETGGITTPSHGQEPAIGTTVGDLGDLPTGDGPTTEDLDAYTDELRQWLENMFNQGGIRVGRGEAGSTDSRNPLEGSPKPGDKPATQGDVGAVIALVMNIWNQLTTQREQDKAAGEAKVRQLCDVVAKQDSRLQKLEEELTKLRKGNPAKRPVVDEVNPGGTLNVGGMAPKKPGEPGDPIPDDQRTEPSSAFKPRGQSTDPNPAAEKFEPGALKTIRTSSDAVTDPPPAPDRVGIVRKFLGKFTAK